MMSQNANSNSLKGVEAIVNLMSRFSESEQQEILNRLKIWYGLTSYMMFGVALFMIWLTLQTQTLVEYKFALTIVSGVLFFWAYHKNYRGYCEYTLLNIYMQESNVLRKSAKIEEIDESENCKRVRAQMRKCLNELEEKKKKLISQFID